MECPARVTGASDGEVGEHVDEVAGELFDRVGAQGCGRGVAVAAVVVGDDAHAGLALESRIWLCHDVYVRHRPCKQDDGVLHRRGGLMVTHGQAHSVAGVDGVLDAQVSAQT
jgi:hypothetical protein